MLLEPDETGVLMRLWAAPGRRLFALAVVFTLGALLIWLAFAQPPTLGWAVVLVAIGLVCLWAGERMRRVTLTGLELTEHAIRVTGGTEIVRIDEIRSVERGAFALKPSNGFVIVTHEKGPRAWAPGLYWRTGRRLGVGGVTAPRETRFMAEQIALMLASRDGA